MESLGQVLKKARENGLIIGVDEVGRGPLAGPVFAAAVIWPKDLEVPEIRNSQEAKAALDARRGLGGLDGQLRWSVSEYPSPLGRFPRTTMASPNTEMVYNG
jgi:hypothetical protein